MEQEFLMRFLEIGAIDLKGDDTKLEKLRSTAKELSATLLKAPSKTANFTMVAVDPNISATDPTIEEVMTSLRKQWETVANAFASKPVGILRAILLDAIVQAARSDDAIAVTFVNTARNGLAYSETANEAEIWQEAVIEIETKVNARAEAEWATPEMIAVKPLQYKPPAPVGKQSSVPTVDRSSLTQNVNAAGSQIGHYQNIVSWMPNAFNMLGNSIADAIDDVAKKLASSAVDISTPLSMLAQAVNAHVDNTLASFNSATAGLQRRTNLLWWKEALYSPSAHTSYLDMPPFEAAALMALDLHSQVPTYSPASVSAFLREAIRCIPIKDDSNLSGERDVGSLVHEAQTTAFMQPLRVLAAQYVPAPIGRGLLLSLIGHSGVVEATKIRDFSGIDPSNKMTPYDWGTYLFRELQAARATSNSPDTRARKK